MKRVLILSPVVFVLLAPRTLLAVDQSSPTTTEPTAKPLVPFDSPVPPTASPVKLAPQQIDPDAPTRAQPRPWSTLPPAPLTGPSEAFLVAGEVLVGSLSITGLGLAGYYGLAYAPSSTDGVPRSTTGSTTLNLGGVAVLLAGPAIAGWLVCTIGKRSITYEGRCGATMGFAAAAGVTLAVVADGLTTHAPPAGCDECASTHSGAATLIGYVAGVTLGAVITWNISKHKKEESFALQPITRAGPARNALADWTAPLVRSSGRNTMSNSGPVAPLIAFSF
jgi:hypothetical protein